MRIEIVLKKQGNQQLFEQKGIKAGSRNPVLFKVECFVTTTKVESWHSKESQEFLQDHNIIIDNTLNKVLIMMLQCSQKINKVKLNNHVLKVK